MLRTFLAAAIAVATLSSQCIAQQDYRPTYIEGRAFKETMANDFVVFAEVAKEFNISLAD